MIPYTKREFITDYLIPESLMQIDQKDENVNIFIFNGLRIRTQNDFFDEIKNSFDNINGIECNSLETLEYKIKRFRFNTIKNAEKIENMIFIFDHYDLFLKDDCEFKKHLEIFFDTNILPFFEKENILRATQKKYPKFALYCKFVALDCIKIKNEMLHIKQEEKNSIIQENKNNSNTYFIYINGNVISTKEEYFNYLKQHIYVPDYFDISYMENYNALADILEDDFQYSEKKRAVLVIDNYNNFLIKQPLYKKVYFEELFKETVLPFFEEEIEYVCHDRKKSYIVYCIDN